MVGEQVRPAAHSPSFLHASPSALWLAAVSTQVPLAQRCVTGQSRGWLQVTSPVQPAAASIASARTKVVSLATDPPLPRLSSAAPAANFHLLRQCDTA